MQYILHARYMSLGNTRNGVTHGNQPRPYINTAPFNVPGNSLAYFPALEKCGKRHETALNSNTIDVSRQSGTTYFTSNGSRYMGGDNDGMSGAIESPSNNKHAINRAAQFVGKDYSFIGDAIYVYNEETSQWDVSLSLSDKDGTKSNGTGLYAIVDNDTPKLIAVYETTDNTQGQIWKALELNGLTNTWEIYGGSSITIDDSKGGIVAEILHGTKLYFTTPEGSSNEVKNIGWYDWSSKIFGTIVSQLTGDDTPRCGVDFVTFMQNLYLVGRSGPATNATSIASVWKVTNSEILFEANIPLYDSGGGIFPGDEGQPLSAVGDTEGRPAAFVDNIFDKNNPVLWFYHIVEGNNSSPNYAGTQTGFSFGAWKGDVDGNLEYMFYNDERGSFSPDGVGLFKESPYNFMTDTERTGSYGEKKPDGTVFRLYIDQSHREIGTTINSKDLEVGYSAIRSFVRYSTWCDGTTSDNGDGDFQVKGGGGDFLNLSMHTWQGSGNAPGHPTLKNSVSWADTGWTAREHRHRAFPHDKMGGGLRQSPIDNNGFKVIDIIPRGVNPIAESGHVRINYSFVTSTGTPNGTPVFVKAHFDPYLHAPETPCKLVAASHGSLSGDYVVANVIADSGTIFSIDWNAVGDGVDLSQPYNLNLTVSTTGLDGTVGIIPIDDPTDIAGLVLWLDASDSSTVATDANGVSAWSDKSGYSAGVSGLTQDVNGLKPLYEIGVNNSLNGMRFFGANDFMFAQGEISQGEQTVFIVYESVSAASNQYMFSLANETPDITYLNGSPASGFYTFDGNHYSEYVDVENVVVEAQDYGRVIAGTSSRTISSGASYTNGTHVIAHGENDFSPFIAVNSGVILEVEDVDDEVVPSGFNNITVGRFTGAQTLALSGIYPSAGNYFNGRIYEIAVYDEKLVSGQVQAFIKYVENKWNLG